MEFVYEYDEVGNCKLLSDRSEIVTGMDPYANMSYGYDSLQRVTLIEQFGPEPHLRNKHVRFFYNDAGQFTAIQRYQYLGTTYPCVTDTYQYL